MTKNPDEFEADEFEAGSGNSQASAAIIDRILSRADKAAAIGDSSTHGHTEDDGDQLELQERVSLRRVAGLSTELQDITEVEYRQLRLERVVLIGIYSGDPREAENSLHELAALAETAGS
ncbi:MAG: hypothetical protein RIQ44_693, partial [Actinomycetota bacterium]